MNMDDYKQYLEKWKKFFVSFQFKEVSYNEDEYGYYISFISWHKSPLRVDVYCGEYREDTGTGGCIAIDFKECFNKVSQCPIYVDLTENPSYLWEAMILLEKESIDFSCNGGEINKDENGKWIVIH